MAATVEDHGGGQRWEGRVTTAMDDDGLQDWVANYDREGQEWAARDSVDSGVAMMALAKMAAAKDSNGGGRRWQMKALDNNGT
jgi:hypothetical protein